MENTIEEGLVEYISDYINEELERDNDITSDTIKQAIDAYIGGAR